MRERLADVLATAAGVVRVAVDGAPCTEPDEFAASLIEPLNARGRAAAHVRARSFWRDASLRLEYGHDDLDSYLFWLDVEALRREVLEPAHTSRTYLPSLRDPATNRSTRSLTHTLDPDSVLLVSGSLLLGRDLPFDRVVHLHAPADQLIRDTPPDERWTLAAYADYEHRVTPVEIADVVIRPGRRSLAVRGLAEFGCETGGNVRGAG